MGKTYRRKPRRPKQNRKDKDFPGYDRKKIKKQPYQD